MPPRELVWDKKALKDFSEYLKTRTNREDVRVCVEKHLLAVASDSSIAGRENSPFDELVRRFVCRDGDVTLNLQAVFVEVPDGGLAVTRCAPIEF